MGSQARENDSSSRSVDDPGSDFAATRSIRGWCLMVPPTTQVAFGPSYAHNEWAIRRQSAREFVE